MRSSRRLSAPFLLFTVLAGLVSSPAGAAMPGTPAGDVALYRAGDPQQIRLTPIRKPSWKPVDLHLFSAPIGTAPGYEGFGATTSRLLPEPNHRPHPALGIGPGAKHAPPYDRELRDGVAALGFHTRGPFTLAEFSNGNGVWLAWMNVPRPGTRGSSPDFNSGPIIPNELFPIRVSGFSTHRGMLFSTLAAFTVPKLDDTLNPPFNVDGHSHFPIFIADNTDFGPPSVDPVGGYRWHLEMVDQGGDGWQIETRFVVRR